MQKLIGGLALLAAVSTVHAQQLAKGDQKILADLAQANLAEIATGKLAVEKGQSADVKSFGQKMVDDHTKGLQEVQQVAQSKSVTLPTEPDAKHKQAADKLSKLSGEAFDRAYLAQAGVKDHKAAHQLASSSASKAKDADVKALAAKLQPTIDAHLQEVTKLAGARDGKPQ
ncbi:DUF4142 domain-containing protein [Oxalobacteraceae bacterium A2-2]